jgi:hypothetical protein
LENLEAKIILKNLLQRVEVSDDGSRKLTGKLTDDELDALNFALQLLSNTPLLVPEKQTVAPPQIQPIPEFPEKPKGEAEEPEKIAEADQAELNIELDISALSLPQTSEDIRLCLDFGTAMSKATLVVDDEDLEDEEIQVLELGLYGDLEDENMLISSVYIDNEGRLWFGKKANDLSISETDDGSRQRIDNIKRWLSEGGLDTPVSKKHNPTDIPITYADMILSYLMFLTWSVNKALENIKQPEGGYPRNISRRFAMPCLSGADEKEAIHRLKQYLGEAQILADTFFSSLQDGIPLEIFIRAVVEIRKQKYDYPFVVKNISEPLGVAGSLISWRSEVDKLIMVVDVGAGTSDLSLYRFRVDLESDINVALEIDGSSRGITEAGNYLDQLLKVHILKSAGIDHNHPMSINAHWDLEKYIRDYKETLFNEGSVFVSLRTGDDVEVSLDDFRALAQVKAFSDALKNTMRDILENIDQSWIEWAVSGPHRNLTVVLTGGGASLPMVEELAKGTISIHGKNVQLVPAKSFPGWLEEDYPELENEFPRLAVSIGGARRKLIDGQGVAVSTAGDGNSSRVHRDPSLQW